MDIDPIKVPICHTDVVAAYQQQKEIARFDFFPAPTSHHIADGVFEAGSESDRTTWMK
jgi:hypothetical protein